MSQAAGQVVIRSGSTSAIAAAQYGFLPTSARQPTAYANLLHGRTRTLTIGKARGGAKSI